jgi:Zn-dependent peptidase ImmA (M78 family)
MSHSQENARQALRGALDVRKRVGASVSQAICIFDTAERLGIEVMFRPENSLGGIYNKTAETVLISTRRPPGRQAFTCAHEIGHWYFKHGTGIDEISELERFDGTDPNERLVDIFASYLLMPPWAVREAYVKRKWKIGNCTAIQTYTVAGQLGVGYETLVQHMRFSLNLVSSRQAEELLKNTPKQLRRSILGNDSVSHLVIADNSWSDVALDLRVGDVAILPARASIQGGGLAILGTHELGQLIQASRPGVARAESRDQSWASFIRVSRRDFVGRSLYRHLEDPDFDENARDNL